MSKCGPKSGIRSNGIPGKPEAIQERPRGFQHASLGAGTTPLTPWDRQPRESARAFEAFAVYRDLGPSRSLQAVAQKLAKSIPLLKRWSARHRWQERVAAYDQHFDRLAQGAEEGLRMKIHEQRLRIAEDMLSLIELNLNKLLERARDPASPPERVVAIARLMEAAVRVIADPTDHGALEVLVRYTDSVD